MPGIILTINAENSEDLLKQLTELIKPKTLEFHVAQSLQAPRVIPCSDGSVVTPSVPIEPAPAVAKKTRKAKAALETMMNPDAKPITAVLPDAKFIDAPAPEDVQTAQVNAHAPVEPSQDVLFAEAKAALGDFVAKHPEDGREKAIEILKGLGATRLTELDAAGLQKFLAAVK